MSEPLGKVSAMGDERRRILLTGEPRGHKEDKAMDREKMLDVTLQQIEKQFGKGAVMKLGEHPMGAGITVIPSGSLALDIALGVGGIPRGRIIEVFGPEGSGKTTVCLHMIAEAQAKGGIAAFIDAEHALDPTYARELGVNIDELLVSQPDSGEQALAVSPTCSCDRRRSTSWSSTRSPRSRPGPVSRARWRYGTSACRRV